MLEYQNFFTRLIKYILEGLAVAIAATLMSRRQAFSYNEIAIIATTAALTFFLLDTLAPSMALSARTGTGFGVGVKGLNMTGGGDASFNESGNTLGAANATNLGYGDATSDAKANPNNFNYGPSVLPVTTMNNVVVSPTPDTVIAGADGIPIGGVPTYGTDLSGTGQVITSGCKITQGSCANGSPLFTQPINNCDCTLDCKPQCQPELQCPVSCPIGQRVFPDCNIASNNSPYKIVPGQYSHQVILPGYNECVKPYNFYSSNI
jgi:hypothetical protein